MTFRQLNNLQQRLIISGLGVAALFICIYLSYKSFFMPIFAVLAAGVIGTAVWEYYNIAKAKGFQPLFKIGLIGTAAYVIASVLQVHFTFAKMLPEIILGITLICSFMYYFLKGSDPFDNLAITWFGILYLAIPLSYLININYFYAPPGVQDGRSCLIYLLFVTKMTDTAAFFVGKRIGKRQLSPYISPKKTWEGACGGLCGAIATSLVFYLIFKLFFYQPPFDISFWQSIWLAVLISITAQFGDLAESLLKRDVGVKDSSRLPGLGGVLDIVDSLVFTSPLMYIFLNMQEAQLL